MEQHNFMFNAKITRIADTGVTLAGLYLRLSNEDEKFGYSVSIETQEAILKSYCKQHGIEVYDVYIDDGLSGGNFNRPGFIRLKEDMENGIINCVITKDLSRLGRDHITTDYLTEIYFPATGIRYIAVDDNVDTHLKPDNEMVPIKNLFNDWYLRDTSKKIKNALRQRMNMGLYIASQTPYGYKKSPDDCNKLIVDDEAAEVVKLIFSLSISGYGVTKICRELERRKILKPSAYKVKQGDMRFIRFASDESKNCRWLPSTVLGMLKDIVYLGHLECHKTEIVNYKTKQKVRLPEKDHIIIENTHEPLVSKEDFDLVARLTTSRYKPQYHEYNNIFKRVIYCANCGDKMSIANRTGKKGDYQVYRCMKNYQYPDKCYKWNIIHLDVVKELVESDLRRIMSMFSSDEKCLSLIEGRLCSNTQEQRLHERIKEKQSRLNEIQRQIRRIYEDYSKKILDARNYKSLLQEYQKEQEELEKDISKIQVDLKSYANAEENMQLFKSKLEQYANFTELTSQMVEQLIERVEVFHPETVDGEKVRKIRIVYRFIGEF